ncbi:MAG: hypothetical protein JXB49_26220 [Bacteroidales bacterium]|nr:hypothetical protein [Bacteroidales bacterium]
MIVERKANQILIKISSKVDSYGIQRIMDYIQYLEATSKFKATQKDADFLADELDTNWWKENRDKYIR